MIFYLSFCVQNSPFKKCPINYTLGRRVKKGVKLSKHNPFKTLLDEKLIAQAFWECLKENDPEGAMEIINAHLKDLNKVEFSKKSDIPRSMRSKNPTLRTVAKLIH